jgi:hypothetical protein
VDEDLGHLLLRAVAAHVQAGEVARDLDGRIGRVVDDDVDRVGQPGLGEQGVEYVGSASMSAMS